jgi:hypothetical protein
LRDFDNRVLRRITDLWKEDGIGGYKKMHNK